MTRRRGWEIDDPTREAWARALRGAVATLEVTEAPRGWKGWSLAAERLKDPYKMSVFLWEPGAPRPEGLAVATPGLTPTILLILGFSGSDVVWGRDLRAPNMRTDQQNGSDGHDARGPRRSGTCRRLVETVKQVGSRPARVSVPRLKEGCHGR